MKSNKRTLMFLTLIAMVFIKLAVGNLSESERKERARCLRIIKYFCGGMDKPNIDDCGKWGVLRYSHSSPDVHYYIRTYFENHIFVNMTAPGLKSTDKFCSDLVENQLELNDYDEDQFLLFIDEEDSDDEDDYDEDLLWKSEEDDSDDEERYWEESGNYTSVKKSIYYEEGSSSSGAEKKFELDDEVKKSLYYEKGSTSSGAKKKIEHDDEKEKQKLKRIKKMLKSQCLDKLEDYTKTDRNDVIAFAMFYVNLITYENPTYRESHKYKINETAKDYLIHVSDKVIVKNYRAQDPVKYCLNLITPESSYLPNEMFPFNNFS